MHAEDSRWGRVRRWWRVYRWWAAGAATLLAILLGFVGFRQYLGPDARSGWDFLYLSLQLFVLESGSITGPAPLSLEVARLLAPLISAYAVWALVVGIFRDEVVGLRTKLWTGHAIVCGLEAGWALTRMLRRAGERVIVIERDVGHPRLEACRAAHIPVIVGDARDEHLLRKVGIRRAGRLFAVCGDDGVNMKVAEQARRLSADRRPERGPLRLLLHIADPYLCRLLRILELTGKRADRVEVDYFSVFDRGAKALLQENRAFGDGSTPRRMLVVGLGRLGRELVVHAARSWRVDHPVVEDPPTIAVVDENVERKLALLRTRHPFLEGRCRLEAVELPADCAGIVEGASLLQADGRPQVSSAFVCLDDDLSGLFVALGLHQRLAAQGVPVVARVYDPDVPAVLPDAGSGPSGGVLTFDLFGRTCRADLMGDLVSRGMWGILAGEIHEVYRRQQRDLGITERENPSMVPWERLPEDLRSSNAQQAAEIPAKLRLVDCALAPLTDSSAERFEFTPPEIDLLAEAEHDRYVREKEEAGWAYGPVRDEESRTNPTLVPWAELPDREREKDRSFVRSLPSLLAAVGLRIVRLGDGRHPRSSLPATRAS